MGLLSCTIWRESLVGKKRDITVRQPTEAIQGNAKGISMHVNLPSYK